MVVLIPVTFILGIICGQGHKVDRAGYNPSSVTSYVTQESAAQSCSVSTMRYYAISPVLLLHT